MFLFTVSSTFFSADRQVSLSKSTLIVVQYAGIVVTEYTKAVSTGSALYTSSISVIMSDASSVLVNVTLEAFV